MRTIRPRRRYRRNIYYGAGYDPTSKAKSIALEGDTLEEEVVSRLIKLHAGVTYLHDKYDLPTGKMASDTSAVLDHYVDWLEMDTLSRMELAELTRSLAKAANIFLSMVFDTVKKEMTPTQVERFGKVRFVALGLHDASDELVKSLGG